LAFDSDRFWALAHPRYEADDLIGSLVAKLKQANARGVIVFADKDLAPLIDDDIQQWDFGKNTPFGSIEVKEKHGVLSAQMAEMQALSGAPVDNIPGIPGIGAKTAAALMAHFGSLEAVLTRWAEVEFLSLRGAQAIAIKLRDHAESARTSYRPSVIAPYYMSRRLGQTPNNLVG
jgi:DNA polymerase I